MWVPVERFPTVRSHPVTREELRKGGNDATAAFNEKGANFSSFFFQSSAKSDNYLKCWNSFLLALPLSWSNKRRGTFSYGSQSASTARTCEQRKVFTWRGERRGERRLTLAIVAVASAIPFGREGTFL